MDNGCDFYHAAGCKYANEAKLVFRVDEIFLRHHSYFYKHLYAVAQSTNADSQFLLYLALGEV